MSEALGRAIRLREQGGLWKEAEKGRTFGWLILEGDTGPPRPCLGVEVEMWDVTPTLPAVPVHSVLY